MGIQHWYLHVDLDAFFASVEQLDHPEYRGKPVIVGGKPEDKRSVVSTASYEARKYGVHSAMPTFQAYKLCPQGIFVYGRMKRYAEISAQIMNIFKDYSPDVDQMSIDEAFIDLTGTEKLFGPPQETAMKIKKQVFENTGLTVSIGLAQTKYLAKIASGYNKPDGFYFIAPGTETEFMLNLPLNKVWGIGKKSLENLNNCGIFSTRNIYERDYDLLKFQFGENTADFLYDIIHTGGENQFKKEVKSHSISAETTFPVDINDIYTAETELLELAQGVFFRLLTEKSYSKTVMVKIRYNDFKTVSIQKTLDYNILTIDSYFEIIKELFEKKYQEGNGIRLLGVGFEKVSKDELPCQQLLFDDEGSEKKQNVEKAILSLTQKHPEIKIQKARTLKSLILAGFLTLLAANGNINSKAFAQEVTTSISGYWNGNFEQNFSFNLNKEELESQNPVFKQTADLTALINVNDHWFFQTDFSDEFKNNTYSIKYCGDYYLQEAFLSNRNVQMINNYSADIFGYGLKGGKNQAPGINLHFSDYKNNKWSADFLVRYDMSKQKSAVYYGLNKISEKKIQAADFLRGLSFILPQNVASSLTDIKNIYVENKNGTYKDKYGKKYKRLSDSDYLISVSESRILFAQSAGTYSTSVSKQPAILVTFVNQSTVNNVINQAGSYSEPDTFLGEIQTAFGADFDMKKYSYSLESMLENEKALVLQNSTGFSPFAIYSYYDIGNISGEDIKIVYTNTSKEPDDFSIEFSSQLFSNTETDYFYTAHNYAKITDLRIEDNNFEKVNNRYPLVKNNPKIYLNSDTNSDFEIIARSYNSVSSINIGTNASKSSVQVYKNGVLQNNAVYNSDSGEININSHISSSDKIYILWNEDSSDFDNGSIAAGIGFLYNFTPDFYSDFSITTKWPVNFNQDYAVSGQVATGFASFSGGINYKNPDISVSEKLSGSIVNPNTTNSLEVYKEDDDLSKTYYLSQDSGFSTKAEPFVNDIQLFQGNNKTNHNHEGQSDSKISGYKIPLYWDFNYSDSNQWAAVDISLSNGKLLKNSNQFQLGLKLENNNLTSDDIEIYLQMGISASDKFYGEDPDLVSTFNISDFSDSKVISFLDITNTQWQTIIVTLDDSDRAKLAKNSDIRIIVKQKNSNSSGKLSIGPYEPVRIPSKQSQNNHTYTTYFEAEDFSIYNQLKLEFNYKKNDVALAEPDSNICFTFTDNNKNAAKITIKNLNENNLLKEGKNNISVNLKSKDVYLNEALLLPDNYELFLDESIIPVKLTAQVFTTDNCNSESEIYLKNIYYQDPNLIFKGQNYINFEWKTEKTGIIENPFLKISSNQNIVSSKNAFNNNDYQNISAKYDTGFSIFNISLQNDASFSAATNDSNLNPVEGGGHSLYTKNLIFNFLDFSENYRYEPKSDTLRKSNSVKFDFDKFNIPFTTVASSNAQQNFSTQNQNVQFECSLFPAKTGIKLQSDFSQTLNAKNLTVSEARLNNYLNGWTDISLLEFSEGKKEASIRNENYNYEIYRGFFNNSFTPILQYKLGASINNSEQNLFTDKESINLNLPIQLKNNYVSFEISRTAGGSKLYEASCKNYSEDSNSLFNLQKNRDYFYSSIPFYELFNNSIYSNIEKNKTQNVQKLFYQTKYEINWKRKLFNSKYDFLVPNSSRFSLSRDTISSQTNSDIYQIYASISNTAINNFGHQSISPLFNWYNQDEFFNTLTAIVKIPSDSKENTKYSLSSFSQLNLYINDYNSLKTSLETSLETDFYWSFGTNLTWQRKGKSSPVSALVLLFNKNNQSEPEIFRKETLSFKIKNTDYDLSQIIGFTHSVESSITKHISGNLSAGTEYNFDGNQNKMLNIKLSIGGKAEF